jgi:hypothetical protein
MCKHEPIRPDLRQGAYCPETVPEPAQSAGRDENQRVRNDRKQDRPLSQYHEERSCSLVPLSLAPL